MVFGVASIWEEKKKATYPKYWNACIADSLMLSDSTITFILILLFLLKQMI